MRKRFSVQDVAAVAFFIFLTTLMFHDDITYGLDWINQYVLEPYKVVWDAVFIGGLVCLAGFVGGWLVWLSISFEKQQALRVLFWVVVGCFFLVFPAPFHIFALVFKIVVALTIWFFAWLTFRTVTQEILEQK